MAREGMFDRDDRGVCDEVTGNREFVVGQSRDQGFSQSDRIDAIELE